MTSTLYDIGIICSLGRGKAKVSQALFGENAQCPSSHVTLLSGRSVPVKQITTELPRIEKPQFNTRTNRLLRVALDEIRVSIDEMKERFGPHRIGVVLATNTSGMEEGTVAYMHYKKHGGWPDGYHYEQQETASISSFASDYLGIKGPAYTISTACSAGNKAILSAHRLLKAGLCDAVITGGADSLCQLTLNGFDSLQLLSDDVTNPFSRNRHGLTLGEGAAVILLTSESGDIQLLGHGESSDAYHMSSPHPSGEGAMKAITDALKTASLTPEQISYINLHGTGTELNDMAESLCIHEVFGDHPPPASSTKPLMGHTLGASGAIETVLLWLALKNEQKGTIPLPPHIFDGLQDPALPVMNFVEVGARISPIQGRYALLNNAFAFGGSNAALIIGKSNHE